jgi:hypothetical protein
VVVLPAAHSKQSWAERRSLTGSVVLDPKEGPSYT